MKQTFKTLALVTLIGGSLTACNSDDTASGTANIAPVETPAAAPVVPDPNLKGTLKLVSTSAGGTGTVDITAKINKVDALNAVNMWNGKNSVEADVSFVLGTMITDISGEQEINEKRNIKVTLHAVNTNPNEIGKIYEYDEIINIDGHAYRVFGQLDAEKGTLRPDIDVVNSESYNAFYITNEGTGTKVEMTETMIADNAESLAKYGTQTSRRDAFNKDVIAAHNEGWTGSGFEIFVDSEQKATTKLIAPSSDVYNLTVDGTISGEALNDANFAAVVRSEDAQDQVTIGSGYETSETHLDSYYVNQKYENATEESALVAGGVALVWNKFDSLEDNQMVDLIEQTSAGKQFNLAKALSPVGNLR